MRRHTATRKLTAIIAGLLLTACIPDGTYPVGPGCKGCTPQFLGLYWSPGGAGGCYFARLRNNSGTPSAIIASDFRPRPGVQIVYVSPPDRAFVTHGCRDWKPLTTLQPTTESPTSDKVTDWDYRVGIDIAPGTWEADPDPTIPGFVGCSWSRLSGFGHTPGEILEEGFDDRQPAIAHQVVHIAGTDIGFTSSGCTTWVRTGD